MELYKNEKDNYTMGSEAFCKAQENKSKFSSFDLTNDMLVKFENSDKITNDASLRQYRSAIRRLEECVEKCIINVTIQEIEDYVNKQKTNSTKNAQRNYIKGFLRFWIANVTDVTVSKEMYMYLILDTKCGIDLESALSYLLK